MNDDADILHGKSTTRHMLRMHDTVLTRCSSGLVERTKLARQLPNFMMVEDGFAAESDSCFGIGSGRRGRSGSGSVFRSYRQAP